jgi:hypothetical protein
MGERSDQIERQIQDTRNSLDENLGELEGRVKSSIDWRVQVSERPGTMLALAFAGGVVLSALFPARRFYGRSPRRPEPRRTPATDYDQSSTRRQPVSTVNAKPKEASDTLQAMKAAIVSVAISKASDLINEFVPGFQQAVTKAHIRNGEIEAQTLPH